MGALTALAKAAQAAKALKAAQEIVPAVERAANLSKFLEDSKVKETLYRGQRKAPKTDKFVTTQGRAVPSFTTDPEVGNVYSRQLETGKHGPGSTSVPVHVQMTNPLDIRGLGEHVIMDEFVNALNHDLNVPYGVKTTGYQDLADMLEGLDRTAYKTNAQYDIDASSGLDRIRSFEELADAIREAGESKNVNRILEDLLPTVSIDAYSLADHPAIVDELRKHGYDSMIHKDVFDAGMPYYQGNPENVEAGFTSNHVIDAYRPFEQSKIKSAIGNRGTYDTTDPDITKATGGEVHMGGGGALKALGALAKTAKAAQDVLPAAEREENLRKFLSRSQLPERLYHATASDFKAFKPGGHDPELSGHATWLTNTPGYQPAYHNTRGKGQEEFRSGTRVMPVHVNAPRVMLIDNPDMHQWAKEVYGRGLPYTLSKEQAEAIKKDYDAVHYADPYGRNESHEILVFDPNRIKSAIGNQGTYDINDPDINKAGGGDVHMAGGGALKALGALGKAAKNLATSDAAYNLANKVAEVTGAAPMQIMMGPKSKTWDSAAAALAEQMEKDGKNRTEIWQATRMVRAPDNKWRQEISDANMKYTSGEVEKKQYTSAKKRYEQAKARATTPEELNDANNYWNSKKTDAIFNLKGDAADFVDHPELFAAYPELAKYTFNQLEPTHNQFTAPETAYGFFSPGGQRITINTDAPFKRSTALHELQHAIQEIEGWQGGSSPEEMAAKMAELGHLKDMKKETEALLAGADPASIAGQEAAQKLKEIEERLAKKQQLEGETVPYDAYRKVSGEEEARMVQARRDYPEEKLAERPPFMDYEAKPWEHITDYAQGGEVHAAGGGLIDLIRGVKDLKALAQRTDRISDTLIKGGMEKERAFNKAREMAAQTILEEKYMPPEHPTAPPLSSDEINKHAERVAGQVTGQYQSKEQEGRVISGKTKKQFNKEQNLKSSVRQNVQQSTPQVVDYRNHIGSMIVGVPGDATMGGLITLPDGSIMGTHELVGVGKKTLKDPVQLYGGPHYGLDNPTSFWASNEGPAQGIQNLIADLGQDYPVLGQYVKMGPGSEAFAMHNLEALMKVLQPERMSRSKREALAEHVNAVRGVDWDKPSKGKPRANDFVGFKNPDDLMAQAAEQSDLRKTIAQLLSGSNDVNTKMFPFGLPSGSDVVTAITHPELRNVEQGASGFAIGEMNPRSGLTPGSHPTYEKDIPGAFIGRSNHPIPYDLAFPDTAAYVKHRQSYLPPQTGHFPLFKMQMGRQKITDQYVSQIDEYLARMKQLTGRKKGGEVEKDE